MFDGSVSPADDLIVHVEKFLPASLMGSSVSYEDMAKLMVDNAIGPSAYLGKRLGLTTKKPPASVSLNFNPGKPAAAAAAPASGSS